MNWVRIVSLGALFFSSPSVGQYFARNSVQLPSLGWMALDSSFAGFNDAPLGVLDQIQIGTGYARDLVDYRLWWVGETAIGFGHVDLPSVPQSRLAVTLLASTGLKYNFLIEYVRPFAGLMIEIFQIFNAYQDVYLLDGMGATWASLRPMIGVEWIFAPDMSIEVCAGYLLLHNFEDPLRHSAMSRVSYRTYF